MVTIKFYSLPLNGGSGSGLIGDTWNHGENDVEREAMIAAWIYYNDGDVFTGETPYETVVKAVNKDYVLTNFKKCDFLNDKYSDYFSGSWRRWCGEGPRSVWYYGDSWWGNYDSVVFMQITADTEEEREETAGIFSRAHYCSGSNGCFLADEDYEKYEPPARS